MTTQGKKRMSTTDKQRALIDLAREQGGLFTARQAESLGFSNSHQFRYVQDGRWTRLRRGIFRLASEKESPREDLHELALFFRQRDGRPGGVFGLETAAALHGIGDFMPRKVFVLVEAGFRKWAEIDPVVELVSVEDISRNISSVGGLQATDPVRTVADLLAAGRDPEEIRRAFLSARSDAIITRRDIEAADWLPGRTSALLTTWEEQL